MGTEAGRSRLTHATQAVRREMFGKIMLAGPAGAGKTKTGLVIAEVLAEPSGLPILMIDTEKRSGLTYADEFNYQHIDWSKPYDPRDLAATLRDVRPDQYGAILVDSTSHFWQAPGGVLDIADGAFTGWKEARPAHADLVEAVLECPTHVILCTRLKMKHEQVNEGGKWKVNKLGLAPVQDADLEYEMNISLQLDIGHTLSIAKSRATALAVGREFPPGHAVECADLYRDWLANGEPPADRAFVEDMKTRLNALPVELGARSDFKTRFGHPDQLTASMVEDAEALVAGYEAQMPDPVSEGQENDEQGGHADVLPLGQTA